jgi:ribosomal protein S18 acetylase RimI-like enzyme
MDKEALPAPTVEQLQSVSDKDQKGIEELTLKRLAEFGFRSVPELDSDLGKLEETYIRPGGAIFVIREGDTISGSVMVKVVQEGVGEVKRFQILQEFRGRGAGKALLDSALAFMRERGFKKAVLDTTARSEAAIALFTKAGFSEVSRPKDPRLAEQIFFELNFLNE